ncbi:hypothetical protein MY8738_007081 [Beauveria namnaoensis]
MKFTLPLLALLAGFAAAAIDDSSINEIDNNELGEGVKPGKCPAGKSYMPHIEGLPKWLYSVPDTSYWSGTLLLIFFGMDV